MSKTFLISLLSGLTLSLGIGICLILMNTSGASHYLLKLNSIELRLGQSYNMSDIVDCDRYEVIIDNENVVKIENDILYAINYGETKVSIKTNDRQSSFVVKVYALDCSFDKSNVILYINGNNSCELNFIVDKDNYCGDIDFVYDEDIISYDGHNISAKSLGQTSISARVTGLNNYLSSECAVEVREIGYVNPIDESPIRLLKEQSVAFDRITYQSGDRVTPNLSYDSSIINIDTDSKTLYALSSGSTQVVISAETSYNVIKEFVIPIIVEDELKVNEVKFCQGSELIDCLMTNAKADGEYTLYTMVIKLNKHLDTLPTIDNAEVVDIILDNNNTIVVSFYKINNNDISINFLDNISNNKLKYISTIEQKEYLQNIDYTFTTLDNMNVDKLYLYNEKFANQANLDNLYNCATLVVNNDVDIIVNDNLLYEDNVVSAVNAGVGTITLSAKDGSKLTKTISFDIVNVVAESISVNINQNIKVDEYVEYSISVAPIYALYNIDIIYDEEYLLKVDNNYKAIKDGETTIKFVDELSTQCVEYKLNIESNFVKLIIDNKVVDNITCEVLSTKVMEIQGQYTDIKYLVNGVESDTTSYLVIRDWNGSVIIKFAKSGEITLNIYNNETLIAILKVTII